MKTYLVILSVFSTAVLAQSLPSPEFGRDIDIGAVLADYASNHGVTRISPRDAQVNAGTTGRVVATWTVQGAPIPTWSSLLSDTNIAAASARQIARTETQTLREIRTNTAASIDAVTEILTADGTNVTDLVAIPNLAPGFTSNDVRQVVNALVRETTEQARQKKQSDQELKAALQQVQALRRYLSEQAGNKAP